MWKTNLSGGPDRAAPVWPFPSKGASTEYGAGILDGGSVKRTLCLDRMASTSSGALVEQEKASSRAASQYIKDPFKVRNYRLGFSVPQSAISGTIPREMISSRILQRCS